MPIEKENKGFFCVCPLINYKIMIALTVIVLKLIDIGVTKNNLIE